MLAVKTKWFNKVACQSRGLLRHNRDADSDERENDLYIVRDLYDVCVEI